MPNFESRIDDFINIPITIDITFPVTTKGETVIACDFCKMYTGRKCILTEEVILNASRYVGYNCPLKKIAKE